MTSPVPPHGIHDSGRTSRGPGIPALPAALLASPSGCAGGTDTTSISTTATDNGPSSQPPSNDHAGEAWLPDMSATSLSTLSPVPTSICIALANPSWRRAMEKESDALIPNNTWELLPRHVDSNVVTDKWIFKHKFNSDGILERYKARWVLRGFTQRPDVDYDETFSLVVKSTTVRIVLSQAVSRFWPIHQLNVKNAFLHSTLSEIVYCSQPTGFVDLTQPDRVCRLNKSLYGLKQAPCAWYNRFATYLLSVGFVEAKSDTSLFIFHCGVDMVYLLLYVDDIILTASSTVLLRHTISALKQEFIMKDLIPLHHFLGVSVQHQAAGLFLTQRQFTLNVLERAGMVDCKPVSMPMDTQAKVSATSGPLVADPTPGPPSARTSSPARALRLSIMPWPTAWLKLVGSDSSSRSSMLCCRRALSSTTITSAPSTSPPTPFSTSVQGMSRSTSTSSGNTLPSVMSASYTY
jgi:hypothetical protein